MKMRWFENEKCRFCGKTHETFKTCPKVKKWRAKEHRALPYYLSEWAYNDFSRTQNKLYEPGFVVHQ